MKPEIVIAISSVIIAAAAFLVAVWQGLLTRQHNKLSVRPFLRIDRIEGAGRPSEILLHNVGVGPSFIDNFDLRVDGASVAGDRFTRIRTALTSLGLADIKFENIKIDMFTPAQGDAIAAGETLTLLRLSPVSNTQESYQALIAALPRLTFSVCYKSIYRETFKVIG